MNAEKQPPVEVKICGVTRPQDAVDAVALGANYVGIVLHAKSKRLLDFERAREIIDAVKPFDRVLGLFNNAPQNLALAKANKLGLRYVQLHGEESIEYAQSFSPMRVIKAIHPRDLQHWNDATITNLHALLLDSPAGGGSGIENDWNSVQAAIDAVKPHRPIWLAGGLNPGNVAGVVERFRPAAVDVASGVEDGTPGVKSREKIANFIREARSV